MITDFFDWLSGRPGWTRQHDVAWAGHTVLRADGFSPFQVACESALASTIHARGLDLVERREEKYRSGMAVFLQIAGTPVQVEIDVDGANLLRPVDRRFEQWDALTPQELIDEFCAAVLAAVDAPVVGAV